MKDSKSPRKRGRPPSAPETRRSERVVSFVTQGELDQLNRLSAEQGCAISAIVHTLISEGLATTPTQKKQTN
jgi:hypothetical protein